jgi:hypothetical protein
VDQGLLVLAFAGKPDPIPRTTVPHRANPQQRADLSATAAPQTSYAARLRLVASLSAILRSSQSSRSSTMTEVKNRGEIR